MTIEFEQPYGLWSLVVINSMAFIIFAFSFAGPRRGARLALLRRVLGLPRGACMPASSRWDGARNADSKEIDMKRILLPQ